MQILKNITEQSIIEALNNSYSYIDTLKNLNVNANKTNAHRFKKYVIDRQIQFSFKIKPEKILTQQQIQDKKEKRRIASKKHYQNNKDKIILKSNENTKKYKIRNYNFTNAFKLNKGCANCGYNKCPTALEFHHVVEKTENISLMVSKCNSLEKIKNEISKCIVLCSNCHREYHYENGV